MFHALTYLNVFHWYTKHKLALEYIGVCIEPHPKKKGGNTIGQEKKGWERITRVPRKGRKSVQALYTRHSLHGVSQEQPGNNDNCAEASGAARGARCLPPAMCADMEQDTMSPTL